jgi:hypothetical protein
VRAPVPLLALAAFLAPLALSAPAQAACYEDIGCTDTDRYSWQELRDLASCQVLWEIRNGIFHENGYCFETARARNTFGNAGCRYRSMSAIPLNSVERANIKAVQRAERANGC